MASQYPFAAGDKIAYTQVYLTVYGTVRRVITDNTYSKVEIILDCGHEIVLYHDDFDKIFVLPKGD